MPPQIEQPTAEAALQDASAQLSSAGVETARNDAEWLLVSVLCTTRSDLYLQRDRPLTRDQSTRYRSLVQRRAAREPLQHVLGETEFFGLQLRVTPDVLVPRPETEVLVSAVVDRLKAHDHPRLLDIGTGSGAIAVAIAHEMPSASCVATDCSLRALFVAGVNARLNGVGDRVRLLQADLLSALGARAVFDAVVANPPYIPSSDIDALQPEVRDHDPRQALDGGPDGLDFYRRMLPCLAPHLCSGGLMALEIGEAQADSVLEIAARHEVWVDPAVVKDFAGRDRVVLATRITT